MLWLLEMSTKTCSSFKKLKNQIVYQKRSQHKNTRYLVSDKQTWITKEYEPSPRFNHFFSFIDASFSFTRSKYSRRIFIFILHKYCVHLPFTFKSATCQTHNQPRKCSLSFSFSLLLFPNILSNWTVYYYVRCVTIIFFKCHIRWETKPVTKAIEYIVLILIGVKKTTLKRTLNGLVNRIKRE